jgi:hypothetical protein
MRIYSPNYVIALLQLQLPGCKKTPKEADDIIDPKGPAQTSISRT